MKLREENCYLRILQEKYSTWSTCYAAFKYQTQNFITNISQRAGIKASAAGESNKLMIRHFRSSSFYCYCSSRPPGRALTSRATFGLCLSPAPAPALRPDLGERARLLVQLRQLPERFALNDAVVHLRERHRFRLMLKRGPASSLWWRGRKPCLQPVMKASSGGV